MRVEAKAQDSGIGITDEQKAHLFNAFEQAEKNTARKYGCTITVDSALGEGSCFAATFCFKIGQEDMLEPKPMQIDQGHINFAGKCALIVDDVEINREIAASLLSDTGIAVAFAENGQQAIELFAGDPEKHHIIFMDMHMPMIDGGTATVRIRSLDVPHAKRIPIVAMTANAFKEDILACERADMNSHIAKPIDVSVLMAQTIKYLSDET